MTAKLKHLLKTPYFVLKAHMPIWKLLNKKAIREFQNHVPTLSPIEQEIVETVKKEGICITSLERLFPNKQFTAKDLEDFILPLTKDAQVQTKKKFYQMLWDIHAPLNFKNPIINFSLHPRIISIANTYMGMWTKLTYISAALNPPIVPGEEAIQSQRWHRDPEEKRMIKVFIYISDVDETAGPFTYIKGSTYGNRYGHLFPQKPPAGIYPEKGAVEKLIENGTIKKEDLLVATGKAGSVIFCDTTGIHRGGYATKKERIMSTTFFAAPTFNEPRWYAIPPTQDTRLLELNRETRVAVGVESI